MKTNFKQLALAGSVAALAGASIPAHAIIMGVPGEAALVPYATYLNQVVGAGVQTTMNTLVRITTPAQLGSDVIMNCYTAPHVTPGNAPAGSAPEYNCNNTNTYSQTPAEVGNTGTAAAYHWFFLDQRSVHRLNGTFTTSGDDTYLFDWAVRARNGAAEPQTNDQLNGVVGYLLITTEAGAQGQAANFAFNAEAYLTYDVGAADAVNNEVVAYIPTLAMADGADAGATAPTIDNNIVEWMGGNLVLESSPLVTGERTIWANGVNNNYVYDIPVAYNHFNIGADHGTIAVVWNDRNAPAWNNLLAYRFNNAEASCSGQVTLPDELNVLYIPPTVEGPAPASFADFPGKWRSLRMLDPYAASAGEAGSTSAYTTEVCRAPADAEDTGHFEDGAFNGGFIKVIAVEPADEATFTLEGSTVFWSWPVIVDAGLARDGAPRTTLLGHSRGAFSPIN